MSFEHAHPVLMTIQTLYPGGQSAFIRDGGEMMLLPRPGDHEQLWLYLPPSKTTEEFRVAISEVVGGFKAVSPLDFEFRTTPSYEADSENDLYMDLTEALLPLVKRNIPITIGMPSKAIIPVGIRTYRRDSPEVKEAVEAIRVVSGVHRVALGALDGTIIIESAGELRAVAGDRPEREALISEDDMTNLKSALGDGERDVLDIINDL